MIYCHVQTHALSLAHAPIHTQAQTKCTHSYTHEQNTCTHVHSVYTLKKHAQSFFLSLTRCHTHTHTDRTTHKLSLLIISGTNLQAGLFFPLFLKPLIGFLGTVDGASAAFEENVPNFWSFLTRRKAYFHPVLLVPASTGHPSRFPWQCRPESRLAWRAGPRKATSRTTANQKPATSLYGELAFLFSI